MAFNPAVLLVEPAAFLVGLGVLRLPVAVLRQRRRVLLGVLAAASAAGAVAARGSATGWKPFDLLLLAALGAVAVAAGSEASSRLLLIAAMGAAAAGFDSLALPLALAAGGLVLVSLLFETEVLVDAAAGGLVAQAALRLSHPGGRGLTALVAAAILVPLLVSAARTLERPHRRRLVRAALGVAGFAVIGAIVGAIAAVSAAGPLRRGVSTAGATLDSTSTVDLKATSAGLTSAARDFAQARSALEAWWVRPARMVPMVAQHWRVLRAAALSGDELAAAGQRALNAPALSDIHITDGKVPLDQLAAIQPSVAAVAAQATAARKRLDSARSSFLVPPLWDKLAGELLRVRKIEKTTQLANRVLPLVPRLLGKDGPRRYFLAVQTPVESRAGGGFMGNYGEITAVDGRVSLTRFGRQDDLNVPGRAERKLQGPEEYVARYGRFGPEVTWANANLSPDFPTDAQVIANLYPQSGGAPIDGVIAVDPAGLAAVLSVVGTVEVRSWPTPITAANALQTLLYDQYQRYDSSDQRVDFLGDVAQEAWKRLTTGGLPPVPQLMSAFAPTVRAKHLFLSSTRADEQGLFLDMGATGRMAPVAGDFVGLVTQNAAGNKIDYFLRREVDYRTQLDPGTGRLRSSAKITLHNDAPAEGVGIALIGNQLIPSIPNGSNKLYLSFYTPWQLASGRVDGKDVAFEQATELGRQVYSTALIIPPKSAVTIELSLTGRLSGTDDYRLDVYRQPMVSPDAVTTTLALDGDWRTATGDAEQTSTRQLDSDTVVDIPLEGR